MVLHWCFHGAHVVHPWIFHGGVCASTVLLWTLMVLSWWCMRFHSASIVAYAFPWCFYDGPHAFPCFHGVSMVLPLSVHDGVCASVVLFIKCFHGTFMNVVLRRCFHGSFTAHALRWRYHAAVMVLRVDVGASMVLQRNFHGGVCISMVLSRCCLRLQGAFIDSHGGSMVLSWTPMVLQWCLYGECASFMMFPWCFYVLYALPW